MFYWKRDKKWMRAFCHSIKYVLWPRKDICDRNSVCSCRPFIIYKLKSFHCKLKLFFYVGPPKEAIFLTPSIVYISVISTHAWEMHWTHDQTNQSPLIFWSQYSLYFLTLNIFKFDLKLYLQIIGTAMGTKVAPTQR